MIETICRQTRPDGVVVTEITRRPDCAGGDLAEFLQNTQRCTGVTEPDIAEAFEERLEKEDGLLFCVGSLYL